MALHTRIMPAVGSPARRLADMSSRIYGQQADPVIGYCPALTRLPHNLDLGVRAHVYVYGAHVYGAHVLVLAVVVLKPGLIWLW